MGAGMGTYVYVDAFNLYYGCLKDSPYKWLNLAELCRLLLPHNDILHIRYFTAMVSARPDNPGQPIRQQTYLRALGTLPNLTIHKGHFLTNTVTMARPPVPGQPTRFVQVVKTEEKGSDVNLATYLVSDAYEEKFDVAAVITGDSDLMEPVRLVKDHLHRRVGIVNPQDRPSFELAGASTFYKVVRKGVLRSSQFPPTLRDAVGEFHKPAVW
jgi:hypothetical protein